MADEKYVWQLLVFQSNVNYPDLKNLINNAWPDNVHVEGSVDWLNGMWYFYTETNNILKLDQYLPSRIITGMTTGPISYVKNQPIILDWLGNHGISHVGA